jgi:hypothetical protein
VQVVGNYNFLEDHKKIYSSLNNSPAMKKLSADSKDTVNKTQIKLYPLSEKYVAHAIEEVPDAKVILLHE